MTGEPSHVVVTPVYEDAEASARLFRELHEVLGPDVFIVAVDDGSVRQRIDPVSISGAHLDGVVLRLRRNVGHQRAIAVGIDYVARHMPHAVCIVMDSDGEDLPQTVPDLLAALEDVEVDVAVATRKSRIETLRFKLFYLVYKLLFLMLTGRGISFGNFMAMKPAATKRLAAMHELGVHLAGAVLVSKLRVSRLPIDRGPRYAGKSKMNFAGLVLHGFQALMVFAEYVLVRVTIACAFIAAAAVLGIVTSVLLKFLGLATPGWFSTALGILVLVLFQTGVLTMMSLMLAGVVKGNQLYHNDYSALVDEVLVAHD